MNLICSLLKNKSKMEGLSTLLSIEINPIGKTETVIVVTKNGVVNLNFNIIKSNLIICLKQFPQLQRLTNATDTQMELIANTAANKLTTTAMNVLAIAANSTTEPSEELGDTN